MTNPPPDPRDIEIDKLKKKVLDISAIAKEYARLLHEERTRRIEIERKNGIADTCMTCWSHWRKK